jgi:hypothetical protein
VCSSASRACSHALATGGLLTFPLIHLSLLSVLRLNYAGVFRIMLFADPPTPKHTLYPEVRVHTLDTTSPLL